MARTSKSDKELLSQVAEHFDLDDRFRDEILSWGQAQVLEEIQKQCKGYWHNSYKEAQKESSQNPDREYESMLGALNKLISQLERFYYFPEQKIIRELKDLQERLPEDRPKVSTPKEILDHYYNHAKEYMEVAEFSKTKIDDLKPIIRDMIKKGK